MLLITIICHTFITIFWVICKSSLLFFQGRLLTGTMITLAIGGGAYVSTADEATFWYIKYIF